MTNMAKYLLFEAYRRNDRADKTKPLRQRWLGLGTASTYKPALDAGLMQWVGNKPPSPRAAGWLVLTIEGIEALVDLAPEFHQLLLKEKR